MVVVVYCCNVFFQRTQVVRVDMAERPEDLNLPNSVVSKIIKEAVCILCCSVAYFLCVLTVPILVLFGKLL